MSGWLEQIACRTQLDRVWPGRVLMLCGGGRIVAVLLGLAMLAAGCSGPPPARPAPAPGTTMTPSSTVTAPPNWPGAGRLSADERGWLAALPPYLDRVLKRFGPGSVILDSEVGESADLLRGCRRILARRPSSSRLQPVYALLRQACDDYDRAAECFVVAARIVAAGGGSETDREYQRASSCGHNSVSAGAIRLEDAMDKAEEINTTGG